MKRDAMLRRILALLLCLSLISPLCARAEEGTAEPMLDPEAIRAMLDGYIAEHKLDPENISIGYVYTATGETWYYNENKWMFSASTYKVPLMMMLAELEYKGELTRDTEVMGLPLGRAEELILTYSNNDYAHLMMKYFGTEPECIDLFKQYASIPDGDYPEDFREWRYFSARFLTEVLTTLYNEPERFPNILECMKAANRGEYFSSVWGGSYEVAQKYGSLVNNKEFVNHTIGIVYTPHPFILTVMTQYIPGFQTVNDICRLFGDYTLSLEEPLARREEAARKAEEERLRAEEAAREQEQSVQPDTQEKQDVQQPDWTAEQPGAQSPEASTQTLRTEGRLPRLLLLGGCGVLLIGLTLLHLGRKTRRKATSARF